jgi:sRNA-binding regulator protein Hfq
MGGGIIYDQDLVRKDPSVKYLVKQMRMKAEVIFVCYTKEVRGVIERIRKYELKLEGRKRLLSKTYILYFFKSDALEAVRQHVEIDEDVVEEKLEPARKIADRLHIPDEVLQKCFDEKRMITVTMRNGHVLQGRIFSYGIFSIRLQIDKKNRVVLFRHGVYDIDYRRK